MHRLTRYSIRSLLVFVTLACVSLGWYGNHRIVHEREAAALRTLSAQMGGYGPIVTIPEGVVLGCASGLQGIATVRPVRPRWITGLTQHKPFHRVVGISLLSAVDDDAIPHLSQLTSLEEIYLYDSRLSHEGQARLHQLFPDTEIEIVDYEEPDPIADGIPVESVEGNPFAP